MRYTLHHNRGENTFETLKDAIIAMYMIAEYDPDCKATFRQTDAEIQSISRKVDSGKYYESDIFALYASE